MGDVIDLAARRQTMRPQIISGICDALTGNRRCLKLLAYENGRWVHTTTCRSCASGGVVCDDPDLHGDCPEPEPRQCAHLKCREPADIDMCCVTGDVAQCDGCCWELSDQVEGSRRWTR